MYKTLEVATRFGIEQQTVRNWAKEFKQYLSITANPSPGNHRIFTDDDLRVFVVVSELKDLGFTFESIHVSLQNGQRGELPPDTTSLTPTGDLSALQVMLANEMRLREELEAQLTTERENLKNERSRADKAETKADVLEQQLREARQLINELNREIGRLEARQDDT